MQTCVIFGDPRLPDSVKRNGEFNPEDLAEVASIKRKLLSIAGFDWQFLDNHADLMAHLVQTKPALVVNFCDEGFQNLAEKELHIPALLELLNIPYTGAGPRCLGTCYDKAMVRAIAKELGVLVPQEHFLLPNAPIPHDLVFPQIVKPNFGDGSWGISQNAVVHSARELETTVQALRAQFPMKPLLIQEFLQGMELTVPIIGNPGNFEFLPLLHINFDKLPQGLPKLLPYEAKWDTASPYWEKVQFVEAQLPRDLIHTLHTQSARLFERLGCCDYARIDFRLDSDGLPRLLEVNPNPGLNWLVEAPEASAALIEKIIHAACRRQGLKRSSPSCIPVD